MNDFSYAPPDGDPTILYLDDDILVADKPAGLLSVPGRGDDRADCLISRLARHHPGVRLVHRLDLDTSGVVIFGLTPQAQAHLNKQFEDRKTQKRYIALVAGVVDGEKGRVDLPLIVDWPNRPRQKICHQTGKPAQTDWRVLQQLPDHARMQLRPITGRSHQLRMHMLALGHPILGDTLYATGAALHHPRLMLHAEELRLRHPVTGAALSFRSPAPF